MIITEREKLKSTTTYINKNILEIIIMATHTQSNTFEFLSVPDMILTIKSAVSKVTAEERVKLGLIKPMTAEKSTLPKQNLNTKNDPQVIDAAFRPPFSQVKLKPTYTQTETCEKLSEKMTDDELVQMTLTAIESSLQQKWQKLTDIQKRNRIQSFAENLVRDLQISSENIQPLFEQLRFKLMIDKSLKSADFIYDENRGEIQKIPSLQWNDGCHKFEFIKSSSKVSQASTNNSADTSQKATDIDMSKDSLSGDKEKAIKKKPKSGRKLLAALIKAPKA